MSKNSKTQFSSETTAKIAELSKLEIDKNEGGYLTEQFNETLTVIDQLEDPRTENVIETSQVTGLKNVFRNDSIDKKRILSQKEALSNAKKFHEGFFVAKAVFDEK
ncbi:hypothetical protein A2714_00140 [Candidatus Woesebacteria bacterium RIFCSPHIGHO2_01_FULL_38_9]|uniref:Aspartyl/glutamyl-tRNA(Asn/Gln) amidotransferase subunit C n=2 Tax=Candidatus Woeseibacteriota TaxID=1752722 RepID=A0A1F7Y2H5_9BACT|nr:MAG: hypothetical protein A2714_00140 [Candidatus Woesebacteria bacterium RIFCSPHIGHO2_01_FULL_38_9]OGM58265.1 MAG: hypothetical protein A3A75_04475 [Candidatus Woesebacteria bacterium RIFCSPLOWO2_01_FULL_39_10]